MVSPTHVGMNRRRDGDNPHGSRVPHTRGDEPHPRWGALMKHMCSPHTWG